MYTYLQIPASVIISNTKSNTNSRNNTICSTISCSSLHPSNLPSVINQTGTNVVMAHTEDNYIASGEKIKPPPQFSEANIGQQVPRLIHPKKRKFDVTEFEDNIQSQSSSKNANLISCTLNNRITESSGAIIAVSSGSVPSMLLTDIKHMTNGLQSENVLASSHIKHFKMQNQPKVAPINTSSEQLGPQITYQPVCIRSSAASTKASNNVTYGVLSQLTSTSQVLNEEDIIDLREWCNHRILAKRNDHYASGVIRSCDEKNKIHVEFDPPNGGTHVYQNIFNIGRFDIVSDASPSISDVS